MTSKLRPTFIAAILQAVAMSAFCQPATMKFNHLSETQGLSHRNVLDIYQDRSGFIWFGTDDGLNLYDGYTFVVFRNSSTDASTLSDNSVHCITEDVDGNLWVGTKAGLNLFNRKSKLFKRFLYDGNDKGSISNDNIDCLLFDAEALKQF